MTAYALLFRPALFHAGDARGVFPFRAFPSRVAVVSLDTRSPPAVDRAPDAPPGRSKVCSPGARENAGTYLPSPGADTARGLGSRVSHHARVRLPLRPLSVPEQPRCSPGVPSSSGLHAVQALGDCFQPPSSRELPRGSLLFPEGSSCSSRRLSGVSIDSPAAHDLSIAGDPPEVLDLFSPLEDSDRRDPLAHRFASGSEPRRRALQTLFGDPERSYRSSSRGQFRSG